MKLIVAMVHHTDGEEILQALTDLQLSVTRIASSGGFLHRRDATLLIAAEPAQVPDAIQVIREHSAPPSNPGFRRATVFVLNSESYEPL